jgi:hypothetical protein
MNEILNNTELKPYQKSKLMLWALLTLCVACGAAWAQAGSTPDAVIVTGSLSLDALLGTFLPPLFAFVMQSHWPSTFKRNISWMLCFVIAVVVSTLQQQQHIAPSLQGVGEYALWVGIHFGAILTVASQTYDKFWQPTGIAPGIEKATTATPTPEPSPDFPSSVAKPVPADNAPDLKVEPLPDPLPLNDVGEDTSAEILKQAAG